ncbi:hypothetical protein ACXC9Q_09225 [Kribbella sp. CWNU-51]
MDDDFLTVLTNANQTQIPLVLSSYQNASDSVRTVARKARRLISGYVWGRSSYHHDASLLAPLRWLVEQLAARQHEDGTYDVGNLHSPPDSAFAIQDVCMLYALLDADGQADTEAHRAILANVIKKAGPALAAGGVHTPNHRWEVSAALARTHHLFPDRRYAARIDDWLDEGIDATPDGIYSERSSTYAAEVTNPSLLTIAWLRGKPELDGDETAYAIELCFRPGGTLAGVEALDAPGNYQLVSGTGSYTVSADRIEFGPGNGATRVTMDPGERFTYLNGSLTPDGLRVYLTGRTPNRQTLTLRTS